MLTGQIVTRNVVGILVSLAILIFTSVDEYDIIHANTHEPFPKRQRSWTLHRGLNFINVDSVGPTAPVAVMSIALKRLPLGLP